MVSWEIYVVVVVVFLSKIQASVVQKLDSAINRINYYPVDKY